MWRWDLHWWLITDVACLPQVCGSTRKLRVRLQWLSDGGGLFLVSLNNSHLLLAEKIECKTIKKMRVNLPCVSRSVLQEAAWLSCAFSSASSCSGSSWSKTTSLRSVSRKFLFCYVITLCEVWHSRRPEGHEDQQKALHILCLDGSWSW